VNSLRFLSSLPDASGKSLLRKLGFGYMLSPMVAYTSRIIMQAIPARVIDDALRREFGIDLEPEVSELARGSRADVADSLGGLVESALSSELADVLEQVGESNQEDLGDCVITTL